MFISNITLRGFEKDQTVRAPLINLIVCLSDVECDDVHEIPIECAVTDLYSTDYDVILPVDVVRSLQVAAGTVSISECVASDVCDVTTKTDPPKVKGNFLEEADSLPPGPEKSGSNLANPVWSNVCIFTQATFYPFLSLILFASFIAVCSGVQYSTNDVTSGTHTAKGCANTSVYGIDPVQCLTPLPVFVSCKLYRRTVLVESERRDELRLLTHPNQLRVDAVRRISNCHVMIGVEILICLLGRPTPHQH